MKPTVGLPTEYNAGCAFGADIDSPLCGQPETVHLIVESPAWGFVGLSSCDAHVGIGLAAGHVLDEHPHGPLCSEGTCWP